MSQTNDPARQEPAYYDARAAMLIGICSLVLIPLLGPLGPVVPLVGLAGLIVSIKAVSVVVRHKCQRSKSMAMTGLITSIACLAILVGWMIYSMNQSHIGRSRYACLNNAKQIGLAMKLYADDNDGVLPPTRNWQELLRKYEKSAQVFQCPIAKNTKYSYGMNSQIGSVSERKLANPAQTVAAFDCSLPMASASGGREAVDFRHRDHGHLGIANITFTDGHAQAVTATKTDNPNLMLIDQVRWNP